MKTPKIGLLQFVSAFSTVHAFATYSGTCFPCAHQHGFDRIRSPTCCGLDLHKEEVRADTDHSTYDEGAEFFPLQRRRIFAILGTMSLSLASMTLIPHASFAAKSLKEEYRQGTAALAEMDDQAPVPREAYKKLDSGVIYADLRPGNSDSSGVVGSGSRINLQWVLRKSNGYFVDSSERNDGVPFIFAVGDGAAIAGLDEAVRGMKVGGVRRILIPPSLAYVQGLEDGKPGPLPVGFGPRQQMRRVQEVRKDVPGEYVYLEVQLTRMR